jgi:signal transduction histidine kinase
MYGRDKILELQKTLAAEQEHQRQIENARIAEENKRRQYYFLGGLVILTIIAFLLYRNNLQQRNAKKTVEDKNTVIEQALRDLKSTQTQLIQAEKMASLGELTAGIAHEIQNPLNFVNNFSDVNREMLDELEEELNKGDIAEAKVIAADIRENEQKINHHGKRADAIVKGMLEHSRLGTGQKQPTDINTLADEFLKLSYHGLRAKDKTFNSELVTHFDSNLPKINVVQQDIGRVLLNLFNNAFYAVNQKSKTSSADYNPEVSIATSTENGQVIIKVKDNGVGIPDSIKEKIMQPFFTTKPTGEGTGLGLSLTYDMVVKGHGGKIDVNTKEHEYTEFIISLPLN